MTWKRAGVRQLTRTAFVSPSGRRFRVASAEDGKAEDWEEDGEEGSGGEGDRGRKGTVDSC
jgi:hypothetical protein